MALFMRKRDVCTSYEELVKKILLDGDDVITEMGDKTKELRNILIEITNPSDKSISKKYPFGENFIKAYTNQLLYGTENEFSYDYHSRLFEWDCCREYDLVNQIDYIIEKLKFNNNSRRALANTWIPYFDCDVERDDKSVPCLQNIQCLVRDNKLEMSVVFRSNDILLAYHANTLGLIALGEMIAEKVGVEFGKYIHYIVSAHIYTDRDRDYLDKYFSEIGI
jgi:thymidylate synthase